MVLRQKDNSDGSRLDLNRIMSCLHMINRESDQIWTLLPWKRPMMCLERSVARLQPSQPCLAYGIDTLNWPIQTFLHPWSQSVLRHLEKLCTRMTCHLVDASTSDVDQCRAGLFPDPWDDRCCCRYRLPSGSKTRQGPFKSFEGLQGSGWVECQSSPHDITLLWNNNQVMMIWMSEFIEERI